MQQAVAKLPWGQNIALMDRVKKAVEREWYAIEAAKHGWSREVLIRQIESGLYERQGKALTNFSRTLPPEQSDLAQEILKDPYDLEFLGLGGYHVLSSRTKKRLSHSSKRPATKSDCFWLLTAAFRKGLRALVARKPGGYNG